MLLGGCVRRFCRKGSRRNSAERAERQHDHQIFPAFHPEERRGMELRFESSSPMFPVGAAPRQRGTQHKGRLRRAYKSVFCHDDKKLSRNLSARRASSRRGLLYRDLLRKAFLDNSRRRTRYPLLGARQGDCLIVVSFELTNLLLLLKIRRD